MYVALAYHLEDEGCWLNGTFGHVYCSNRCQRTIWAPNEAMEKAL